MAFVLTDPALKFFIAYPTRKPFEKSSGSTPFIKNRYLMWFVLIALALTLNEFLGGITAHFRPLEPLSLLFGPVPVHLYVSQSSAQQTLCALKVKKSPAPELIPNILWKEFAFEISPVLTDIYNWL